MTTKRIPESIEDVPASYLKSADHSGKLERLTYSTWESKTYASKRTPLTKEAIVYTPYGMDPNEKYDVFFLMHGGWSNQTTILGTPQSPGYMKNIVDHMIENGEIDPVIIVCPPYNNTSEEDSADYGLALQLTARWPNELKNDLMPAVAKNYPTWAASAKDEELRQSRDHWYFGGFSMGSVTTWHVFEQALGYIHGFMPSSGNCSVDPKDIEKELADNGLNEEDFFIYAMTGSEDFAAQSFTAQIRTMQNHGYPYLESKDGTSGNVAFRLREGFSHDGEAMMTYFYNGLKWFAGPEKAENAKKTGKQADNAASALRPSQPFTASTTVSEVKRDPAFAGFGELLFPVDQGYMYGSTLGTLDFAWYSLISSDKSVEILNYLKAQAEQGKQIFYPIYTEQEMQRNPDLRNTGLFFFRGKENAPFAIVSAGGGFAYVAALHDSFPQALEISKSGNNAFALIYRPGAQSACEDLSRAIAFIFDHADELKVDTKGYSLWGGSAGGRMSAWVSEMGTAAFGAGQYPKPAADIIQYTGLREASRDDVPTWMNVGTSDGIASSRVMKQRSDALNRLKIQSEIEIYPGLSHGFSLALGTPHEGWVERAIEFWMNQRKDDSNV